MVMCKINWSKIFKKNNLENKLKELYDAISTLEREQFHTLAGYSCYWSAKNYFLVQDRIKVTRQDVLLTGNAGEEFDYCKMIDAIVFDTKSRQKAIEMGKEAGQEC